MAGGCAGNTQSTRGVANLNAGAEGDYPGLSGFFSTGSDVRTFTLSGLCKADAEYGGVPRDIYQLQAMDFSMINTTLGVSRPMTRMEAANINDQIKEPLTRLGRSLGISPTMMSELCPNS